MAFLNAQQSRLLIGPRSFSGETRKISAKNDVMALDATTLIDTASKSIPGIQSAAFALDLLLDTDTTAGGEWDQISTLKSTPMPLSYAMAGFALGNAVWLIDAIETSATVASTDQGIVTLAVAAIPASHIDHGVSLLDLSTNVAAAGVVNQTSVDNAAATVNGGVAHLHVTAFATYTNDTFRVEHSTDNSSFTTLGTFTVVTGTTYQRLVIAAGTTVNRYVRCSETTTGSTGSVTRQMSFNRR